MRTSLSFFTWAGAGRMLAPAKASESAAAPNAFRIENKALIVVLLKLSLSSLKSWPRPSRSGLSSCSKVPERAAADGQSLHEGHEVRVWKQVEFVDADLRRIGLDHLDLAGRIGVQAKEVEPFADLA